MRIGGTDHSWVDPNDPTRLEFDYVQRIADAVDGHAPAGERIRVVHIGGAGMTLPRYIAATRPTSAQIVLEPDTALTELVREQLPLPKRSGIKVRPVDGRAGIAAMPDDFADVVILDAFVEAQVPAELTTIEFFSELSRVLVPGGAMMLNLTDRAPFGYTRRVLAGVREFFSETVLSAEPATLKGRRFGNLLVLGSDTALPVQLLTRRAAASVFPYRVLHGHQLGHFVSEARGFTYEDSQWSPEPPDGPMVFR